MLNGMSHEAVAKIHVFGPVSYTDDEFGNEFMVMECQVCGKSVAGEKWADLDGAEEWAGPCDGAPQASAEQIEADITAAELADINRFFENEPLTHRPFAGLSEVNS